jgi:hypothetical protein
MRKIKPALVAIAWALLNIELFRLMMDADHTGSKPLFIFFRILLAISVIMMALIAIGLLKVTDK